jgi:RNA polymerase sigma-70 factor (ECF subfamily)
MEPDQSLGRVHRVQDDEVAELYAVACPRLIGLLTVMGGSRADAEEVAQESFVRLLEHWPKVRGYEDPEGWVRTVAIRMLVSRQRRRITAAAGLRRLASRARVAELPPVEPDMDLVAALATLPVAHRAVVVLHHLYDLPVGEVAARLRIPVGTVKSRLSRARTALAPFLDDERSRT